MDPEVFWGRLNKIVDDAGAPQFNVPCSLLCLPHANVDVEQSVNLALCTLLKLSGEWLQLKGVLISLHNDMSYFVCYFRL